MAWIDGAFLTAYALGQFISGVAGNRYGTRKVILTGMVGSVLAAAAMGASSVSAIIGIFFCLQGLCQSSGWAPLTKNIGCFFSQRQRGTIMGLWCTNYAVGGLVASIYAGYCGSLLGWRYAFFVPAATLFRPLAALLLCSSRTGRRMLAWCRLNNTTVNMKPLWTRMKHQREPEEVLESDRGVLKVQWCCCCRRFIFLWNQPGPQLSFWGPEYWTKSCRTIWSSQVLSAG